MESEGGLAVKAWTESGQKYTRMTAADVRAAVTGLGRADNRFLVAQRIPDLPDVFAQVWHEEGGDYQLEHRRGRDGFFGTRLTDPGLVADLLTGWARQEDGWDAHLVWEPVDLGPAEEVPDLPQDVREQVEERVRLLLRCGYDDRAQLTEDAEEWLVDGDERPVSRAQAGQLVDRLWLERLGEQETWPTTTDPERLTRAFDALNTHGITARENFTCCRTCGTAEIGAERAESDRGFVYFHSQCTESAAEGRGLMLLYGGFDGTADTGTTVGREVVAALTAAGLSALWDGNPDKAIEVSPLNWRKRLTG
ncbi:hypothetical protein ADK65_21830 [Streptomyces sp. NRRL B-1140]|uniref:DUF6891 domain-containing protein n=1 Tax=Streptomyces sp. NRRL B-1140 TaxID=1415549 RepID=UPI0006AFD116|nr:hypothetical protein [Streptomyces sp. NRRL B-1140]KOV98359.1 hypothetical protein ADK65_21830 [Streptomyces sp. NRRL B-1140]